jgi:hypothetical protein
LEIDRERLWWVVGMEEGRASMDDVLRRISERLARPSSRRGLVAGLGKLVVGAAAAVAAQSLFGHVAEAAALMHCCDGKACAHYACPAGTHAGYTWSCGHYFCHDCFSNTQKNSRGRWAYVCTYSLVRRPRVVHHTTQHAAQPVNNSSGQGGSAKLM